MEKRIKTLYIVTIVAILAFLSMQAYWLYGRYEFSLGEYDAQAVQAIVDAVADLNRNRAGRAADGKGGELTHSANYNISHSTDSLGRHHVTATITLQKYFAHSLLGIDSARELSSEEKTRVALMVLNDESLASTIKHSYDASNAPTDADVWRAFDHSAAEFLLPLTAAMVDSVLSLRGFEAEVELAVTDTMIWVPEVVSRATAFHPAAAVSVPYSELERKSVVVAYQIPVSKVVADMLGTLIVVALLSLFLIICLVLQFATILKLSRLDAMRTGFVTTMIHELKRPISTLKMCVSGLENERMASSAAVRKELLTETRTALNNLSAYFSKLRDITFNDVEQIPLNISPVPLRELFEAVAASAVIPTDKRVTIANHIDPALEVSADRSHLYNVLTNLVENAVKYSGPAVDITATATDLHGRVELRIADTGIGIPPAHLRHIFKRFYRGDAAAGPQPGIGLGLAYVKMLVEAHGGTIAVESTEGRGTCFTIILPQ